jgi:hypothetical protein
MHLTCCTSSISIHIGAVTHKNYIQILLRLVTCFDLNAVIRLQYIHANYVIVYVVSVGQYISRFRITPTNTQTQQFHSSRTSNPYGIHANRNTA